MKMAEIKTIYKGESVTLLFTFPEAYDMARLASHKIFVGETEFAGVVEGQAIRMQLKSSDTDHMIGTHKVVLWIDDAVLGLRKPYCCDLVVAKTQASGSNASVSNISDIIIPDVISETAVTVGDILYNYVKGDKGDPFTYSDFTPEQIAELQQPASDAIASIKAVEQSVEHAEGLRVIAEQTRQTKETERQSAETTRGNNETARTSAESGRVTAEGLRQTNTSTAIQNANTATTNANNAANLANTKAGLANDAATLANTKAGLADTAATNANNVANTYAAELAAKELKANKQNSLTTDGTGTKFPTVDAVNGNIATQAEAEANTNNAKWMTPLRVFQNWAYNVANYVNSTLTTVSKTIIGAINELKGQTPAATTLQTVTDKNQYYPISQNNAGTVIGRHIAKYWNGSSWGNASTVALGEGAAQNTTSANGVAIGYQAGTNMSSNGIAIGYQAGTNISDQTAIGYRAMNNFTGAYSTAVGHESAKNGTLAHYTTAFGAYSQGNNCAGSSCSFGSFSLLNNTGVYSNGFGLSSLQNNTGAYSNGFGSNSLLNNTGGNSNGFGTNSLLNNTGGNSNGFGANSLKYNQSQYNTAFGDNSYGTFLDNVAGNKTAASTDVNITDERITLIAHGFGSNNSYVNIKYASTDGTAIGGLTVGSIYQVKIIDANTVEFWDGATKHNLTSQGTGYHTFTPQFAYTNTTCLGANTQPNRSNQVVLGSTAVDTVKMGGTARTPASATAAGEKGETCWDANYFYICVATNTWKRIALTTW